MKKVIDFVCRNKFLVFLILVAIFILPLFIVHILYKVDCKIEWLQSEWAAGDVLTYIAGFEAFIGTVLLGFLALWQNHQIHEQHIDSLEPNLSMNLINEDSILYLLIENTGGVAAKDIIIEVLSICNNGKNNELSLDGLFNTIFELYPNEKARGRIAISGENIITKIFPQIKIKVSYTRSDLLRKKVYERTVVYNNEFLDANNISINSEYSKVASDIDKIARANVRIANYLDGHQVAKFDEINIIANRSLRNDLVEAINTKQETPIYDREYIIDETLKLQNTGEENNGKA